MKKNCIKNIMLLTAFLLISMAGTAQTIDHGGPQRMWTVPAVFSVDEEVTFYFDMNDAGFKEGVDLYLWCWNPSEPDAGNWENSSDFAKLTYQGDNIYTMTMVPTKYFSSGASSMSEQEVYDYCQTADWPGFWCRLKTKDGSEESDVFQAPDSRSEWADFAESGKDVKFYSGIKAQGFKELFTLNDPLTVVFNGDLFTIGGRTMNEVAQDADFIQFGTHAGLNDWEVQQQLNTWRPKCLEKVKVKQLTNGYWVWNIGVPGDYFATNPGDGDEILTTILADADTRSAYELENICYLVVKVQPNGEGNPDWGPNSGDKSQKAGAAVPYPDPVFGIFPTKFTPKDIITLTRQYNERNAGELKYIIKAGSKTLTGEIPGVRDKRTVTLNLTDELSGTTASEIEIEIQKEDGTPVEKRIIQVPTED